MAHLAPMEQMFLLDSAELGAESKRILFFPEPENIAILSRICYLWCLVRGTEENPLLGGCHLGAGLRLTLGLQQRNFGR